MKTIAVIGTGIMGSGIASNFLKQGFRVYVWNRDSQKLGSLIAQGAVALDTPRQGADLAEIIFEVTANDESSRSVWTSEDGILSGAKADSILISCATISVEWVDELSKLCRDKNYTFFDMPMTGGRVGAESGNLVLLVGGMSKSSKR